MNVEREIKDIFIEKWSILSILTVILLIILFPITMFFEFYIGNTHYFFYFLYGFTIIIQILISDKDKYIMINQPKTYIKFYQYIKKISKYMNYSIVIYAILISSSIGLRFIIPNILNNQILMDIYLWSSITILGNLLVVLIYWLENKGNFLLKILKSNKYIPDSLYLKTHIDNLIIEIEKEEINIQKINMYFKDFLEEYKNSFYNEFKIRYKGEEKIMPILLLIYIIMIKNSSEILG